MKRYIIPEIKLISVSADIIATSTPAPQPTAQLYGGATYNASGEQGKANWANNWHLNLR